MLPHSPPPSPTDRRVGIHNFTFEACSDFTRVTARWVAQPPKAAFVTRLRDGQLPDRPARQLPDQPTTLWVVPSSTGDPRLRGALSAYGSRLITEVQAGRPERPLWGEERKSGCPLRKSYGRLNSDTRLAPRLLRGVHFEEGDDTATLFLEMFRAFPVGQVFGIRQQLGNLEAAQICWSCCAGGLDSASCRMRRVEDRL